MEEKEHRHIEPGATWKRHKHAKGQIRDPWLDFLDNSYADRYELNSIKS